MIRQIWAAATGMRTAETVVRTETVVRIRARARAEEAASLGRSLRQAWYRVLGLPELRAQVWLHPRVPLLRRLRGDHRATISACSLPVDMTLDERMILVAELHHMADFVARDPTP